MAWFKNMAVCFEKEEKEEKTRKTKPMDALMLII